MTAIDYVIVGAEVDQARRFLLPNGQISGTEEPGAKPLNVEFIGELMVRLSKLGKAGVTPAEMDKFTDQVKSALQVSEIGGPDGPRLSEEEMQAILDNTTVSIAFETRLEAAGQTDRNTRMLTVPSDNTLAIEAASLQATSDVGFRPPLTYPLDQALMLASLSDIILGIIDRFGLQAVPGWTADLQTKLKDHINNEIKNITPVVNGAGDAANSVLNEIMQSPLRAFHRSVGIYATNMCR
jgi:hypothetical protein